MTPLHTSTQKTELIGKPLKQNITTKVQTK